MAFDFSSWYNSRTGEYLNNIGNYLVQSEIDAGVRNSDGSYVSPAEGSQTGIFDKPLLDEINSGKYLMDVGRKKDDGPDDKPWYVVVPANTPEYINADLAKAYGMDTATAYQEALANTAHQREIKDLQAAGLNPVLSTRYGGASGVSGAQVMSAGTRSSGGSSTSDDGFLGKFLSGATLLAGLVAGIAMKNTGVVTAASTAAKTLSNIFK